MNSLISFYSTFIVFWFSGLLSSFFFLLFTVSRSRLTVGFAVPFHCRFHGPNRTKLALVARDAAT
jgi:hypothetical protein